MNGKNALKPCQNSLYIHPHLPYLKAHWSVIAVPALPFLLDQPVLHKQSLLQMLTRGAGAKRRGRVILEQLSCAWAPLPLATEVPDRHLPCPAGLGAIFQWPSPLKPPRWSVVSGCAGASRRLLSWQCNSKSWAYVSNCPEQDRNWWEPNSSFSGFVVTLTRHLLCRNKSTKYNYFENETFLDVEKRSNSREEKDRKRRTREIRLRQWLT